jgi:phospholipase D1/2
MSRSTSPALVELVKTVTKSHALTKDTSGSESTHGVVNTCESSVISSAKDVANSPKVQPNHPIDTPSSRTGPPRSLSFHFSNPRSSHQSRSNINPEYNKVGQDVFTSTDSGFRGAFEPGAPAQDKKGKRREVEPEDNRGDKQFHDSPTEERGNFNFNVDQEREGPSNNFENKASNEGTSIQAQTSPQSKSRSGGPMRRAVSAPHPSTNQGRTGTERWRRLRALVPRAITPRRTLSSVQESSAVTSHSVNITDELITGRLSTLMLRLWFERDENDQRRIPILFHRLRIRVSDSLHPLHGHKAVFRIECDYANGIARWVIYRQLRDFLSLHTHYAISNAYNHKVHDLPEFPRTSTYMR